MSFRLSRRRSLLLLALGLFALATVWVGCGGQQPPTDGPEAQAGSPEPETGKSELTTGELDPETDEFEPPEPLPQDIVQAWKAAGAQVGWMRIGEYGFLEFISEQERRSGDLPAFNFRPGQQHISTDVPGPKTPFGLCLAWTRVTDAGVQQLREALPQCCIDSE